MSRPSTVRGPGERRHAGRLSRSADFDRVYRNGRSQSNRHLVLYSFPRGEGDAPRLGVSVSRRVGGAVDRNRVKRLLREAFAGRTEQLAGDCDYVIVARPDARDLVEREGLGGLDAALGELLGVAGAAAGLGDRGGATS